MNEKQAAAQQEKGPTQQLVVPTRIIPSPLITQLA
jgi:hypothetical protein